ncbi:hypothetical protein [Marinovum algicola]
MNANDIVGKLWRMCTILRKDGITYQQYVTELWTCRGIVPLL